jgi:DNA polymerase III epsilon subunit-like protein
MRAAVRRAAGKMGAPRRVTVLYYDLETTGLSVRVDRIVQLAATTGKEHFVTLVQPTVPVPLRASSVHGLTDERLRDAPTFPDAWKLFQDFVGRICEPEGALHLVGHNSRVFDDRLLLAELIRHGMDASSAGLSVAEVWRADSLVAARQLQKCGGLEPKANLRLEGLHQQRFGEVLEQAHDALADCRAVQRLLEDWPELRAQLSPEPWSTAVQSLERLCEGQPQQKTKKKAPASPLPRAVPALEEAQAVDVERAREEEEQQPKRARAVRSYCCKGCGRVVSLYFLHRCSAAPR